MSLSRCKDLSVNKLYGYYHYMAYTTSTDVILSKYVGSLVFFSSLLSMENVINFVIKYTLRMLAKDV